MYIREIVIALLLINACFFIGRLNRKDRRRGEPDPMEVRIKSVGYLVVNIICIGLAFYLDK
ncbi:hypothetical protein [Mucilaginibacter myungsuensis]|uniref:Uncharacterized protein n=1 Tax=Mucilaginibacter myungsuensis TaxID=649104 RepID=A0A929KUU5_9SPHI|nr:hypothetical protein [Mucilaginibacter myungsuensis]MBE9660865.1 hypothetical protein [Mucilaginibacter myungsuensis]MDN3600912.1 hypothetical protein [Mucilaginibacter myungsuensis]